MISKTIKRSGPKFLALSLGFAAATLASSASASCPCFTTEQIMSFCSLHPQHSAPHKAELLGGFSQYDASSLVCSMTVENFHLGDGDYRSGELELILAYSGHNTTRDRNSPLYCTLTLVNEQVIREALSADQHQPCRQAIEGAAERLN